jgi:aspartyl-tRNA synthetase
MKMEIAPLGNLARTHTCGELTSQHIGQQVVLLGWVHRTRDLGHFVFVDLRDRHGLTQVVARENDGLVADAKRLRGEFVIAVLGKVVRRESANPKMATGEIEVEAREIRLLNCG